MKTMYQLLFAVCVAIIMASTYQPCSAQVQRANILLHTLTSSSCTIGIAEINNQTLTSCTVQISVSLSLLPFPAFAEPLRATLTTQTPRTTFALPAGSVARIDVIDILPKTSSPFCFSGNGSLRAWSSPYFVSNSLLAGQATITDSRIAQVPLVPPIDQQDSLIFIINASAGNYTSLRLTQAVDSALFALRQRGFAVRDAWVNDAHTGACDLDMPAYLFGSAVIRLQRPSEQFFSALQSAMSNILRCCGRISRAPFPVVDTSMLNYRSLWGDTLMTMVRMSGRYYNFSTTTSVRTTQQEPELAMRISPQPLSGAGLMSLTVQRPRTADIRVVNMLGQIVATLAQGQLFSIGETTIPCSFEALSSGVYAVQVVSGGRILHTQNIVVTR